jgi:hypothetical protein
MPAAEYVTTCCYHWRQKIKTCAEGIVSLEWSSYGFLCQSRNLIKCEIYSFRRVVVETFALLGRYAAYVRGWMRSQIGLLDPWRWDVYTVPKRRQPTKNLSCVTSQKSECLTAFKTSNVGHTQTQLSSVRAQLYRARLTNQLTNSMEQIPSWEAKMS